jgi:hypothetical protein
MTSVDTQMVDIKENHVKHIGAVVVAAAMLVGAFTIGRNTAPTPHRPNQVVPLDAHHRVYCPGHPGAAPGPFVAEANTPGPVNGCQRLTAHEADVLDSLDLTNREDLPAELCNENDLSSMVGPGCRRLPISAVGSQGTNPSNGTWWFVDSEGRLSTATP